MSSPENAPASPPTNRLAQERSPYLLQHARNPVDWYPWGPEALARARQEEKPIFLSVGYSACHWCHVMERESFEDPVLAAALNAGFVAIKVDREERPDIDDVYMTAVQMMTGHGGWPMSVFLTPDGRPFYGGTYFPPTSRQGRIGFGDLLGQLSDVWRDRREEVERIAANIAQELQQAARQRPPAAAVGAFDPDPLLLAAVTDLATRLDEDNGGFHAGGPKFPPHHALRLLVVALERDRTRHAAAAERPLISTLDHMALGGIYDHVVGGFHRYATDAVWLLPHFEKMLYDNALLAGVYARASRATGRVAYARIARETLDWCLDRLRDAPGDPAPVPAFYAALDADSEGEEGRYYVWTRDEAQSILGDGIGPEFCDRYNLLPRGNFRDEATGRLTGTNIPHLSVGPAAGDGVPLPDTLSARIAAARAALLAARDRRVPPATDDKVVTAWNGLMIGSLAIAGQALDEPRYIDAARDAATFCLTVLRPDGVLLRRYARGESGVTAFLDDHAYLADGLLDLHAATGEARWLDAARSLADTLLAEFWDPEEGGFFSSGSRNERLIAPTKDLFDGALPSANGVAARVLARLGNLPDGALYAEKARTMLVGYRSLLERVPHGTHTLIEAAILAAGPVAAAHAPSPSAALAPSAQPAGPVTLVSLAPALRVAPGGRVEALFELRIAPGYHVNSTRPLADYLIPTSARVTSDLPAAVGPVSYPAPSEVVAAEERLSVYVGSAMLRVPIAAAPDAEPGRYTLTLTVRCQPCSETECQAPQDVTTEITVTLQA